MAPPPIYLLPAALRRYRTKAIRNTREQRCSLCWRDFSTKGDTSDLEEIPCHPIKVFPCHHVFGDHCFIRMTRSGISKCPSCRTSLAMAPDESLDDLDSMATFSLCKYMVDFTNTHIRRHGDTRNFDALNQRLFDGTMNYSDAIWLWYLYVHGCAMVTIRFIFRIGLSFISVTIFPRTSKVTKTLAQLFRCLSRRSMHEMGDITMLCRDIWDWVKEVVVHVRGPLFMAFIALAAFAVVVARLIWTAVRRGERV